MASKRNSILGEIDEEVLESICDKMGNALDPDHHLESLVAALIIASTAGAMLGFTMEALQRALYEYGTDHEELANLLLRKDEGGPGGTPH